VDIILLYKLRFEMITIVGYKLNSSEDMPLCGLVSVYQILWEIASSFFGVTYSYRQGAPYFRSL